MVSDHAEITVVSISMYFLLGLSVQFHIIEIMLNIWFCIFPFFPFGHMMCTFLLLLNTLSKKRLQIPGCYSIQWMLDRQLFISFIFQSVEKNIVFHI